MPHGIAKFFFSKTSIYLHAHISQHTGNSSQCQFAVVQSLSCIRFFVTQELQPARLLCPWDFPGKNTGLSCRFLFHGIFPSQGSSLHLLPWQEDSLLLDHKSSVSITFLQINAFYPYFYLAKPQIEINEMELESRNYVVKSGQRSSIIKEKIKF